MLNRQLSRLWLRISLASDVLFGFPYRLVMLYWFIQKRHRQCGDFAVGDTVRLRAPSEGAKNSRVLVTPEFQDDFTGLGKADESGNRELKPTYAPGSSLYSFYIARDPWKVVRVEHDIAVRNYLKGNRHPPHPCLLVVQNLNITIGDRSPQFIGGNMVEKV